MVPAVVAPYTAGMTRLRLSLCFAALLQALPAAVTATPPPPERVALTPDTMKQLGFAYRIWRKGTFSYIALDYPARIGKDLSVHSTDTTTRDRLGTLLHDATASTEPKAGMVSHRFDHGRVDVTIDVAYCETGVSACREFAIESVTAFIQRYAKPDDLLSEGGVEVP